MTVTLATLAAGLVAGLGIGGLAAGLVLIYRASRVVNLAHAELGGAAAALCAWLVRKGHLPFGVAALVAVAAAAAAGALTHALVVRRVAAGSAAAVVIATAGVAELLLALGLVVLAGLGNRGSYPVPFRSTLHMGHGVVLHGADVALLAVIPFVAVGLAVVLRATRVGAAMRAAADNPDAARLAGVPVAALAACAWAAAGGLSAIVVICLLAGRPIVGTESLGPEVLFEALAATVVARFEHLPRALAAGVCIGVVHQVVGYNWPGGAASAVLFALVAGAALLLWRRRPDAGPDWLLAPALRRAALPARGAVALGAAAAGVMALLVAEASNSQALTMSEIAAYGVLAISATLIVGVAGHLSLGQVAFFGVGAAVSYQLSAVVGVPFWLAFLAAGVGAGVASALVGLPAVRARGPMFAVTSLGFALAAAGWLLRQRWMLGPGAYIPRPILGPIDLAAQRSYLMFALVVLAASAWLSGSLGRRRVGRQVVAVRDNEPAAAAFGVVPATTKLVAFAAAGFLAGVAGAVYGHGLQSVSVNDFPVASPGAQIAAVDSLRIVAIAVMGGLGSIWGAVAATVLIVGVDELTSSVALHLATTGAGVLLVLLLAPGGLAGAVDSVLARRRGQRGAGAPVPGVGGPA